jgi:hypothetical protein
MEGRLRYTGGLALALLTSSLFASSLAAEGWDAARAERLAREVETSLAAGLELSDRVDAQPSALQQRTRDAAIAHVRRLYPLSRAYRVKLGAGWSADESEPFFAQLEEGIAQARATAARAVVDPDIMSIIDNVESKLEALAALYRAARAQPPSRPAANGPRTR